MKNLPLGVQTFSDMIEENYLYVDKTREIFNLFSDGGKYYFLSRPRRFGKSLLVSTLGEIFSGNRELFKDLWIYDKIKWEKYPVIQIDFSELNYETPRRLEETLGRLIEDIAGTYDISLDPQRYYNEKFAQLIKKLSAKGKVVVLIDEYDKPIIDKIDEYELASENRDILKAFFNILKSTGKYIKFAFITGVSKFSKVSVFSGLNNLRDITISDRFSTLLGYTEEELQHYFEDRMVPGSYNLEKKQLQEAIRVWYNGYSWDGTNFMYNPHSILAFFQEGRFDNYWFTSGTPSFLIKLLKEKQKDIREYERKVVGNYVFESYDIDNLETTSLMFQTGYLTIKERRIVKKTEMEYTLSYPNKEVRESFIRHLFRSYTGREFDEGARIIRDLTDALSTRKHDHFFDILKSLFASISYNIFIEDKEAYYHSIIYMIVKLMGVNIQTEVQTNKGRIDAVIETEDTIYLMEFKMGSETEALEQIKQMGYYEKYAAREKKVMLVGVGFDREERNIGNYVFEQVKK